MNDDDHALVDRARRGDRAAFSALVGQHEVRLRHFLSKVVGPANAGDAAQEAFVKAWLALDRYRGEASFAAWLAGIGWRVALDRKRSAARELARDAAWHGVAESTTDSPGTARVELERALAALSDHERAALVLTHGHGWSQGEAAAILGLPLGTLKSLAARARAKARAAIAGTLDDDLETAA